MDQEEWDTEIDGLHDAVLCMPDGMVELTVIQFAAKLPDEGDDDARTEVEPTIITNSNRAGIAELGHIDFPSLNVRELWVFGAIEPDHSRWALYGNLLSTPHLYVFDYPTPDDRPPARRVTQPHLRPQAMS